MGLTKTNMAAKTQSTEELLRKMSRVIYVSKTGGVEVMQVKEEPIPEVKEGHVLLNVKATGINFAELMCRQGLYDRAPPTPSILGFEASGVVDAVGEGVTTVKVGDRVLAASDFGLWREHACVHEQNLWKMPDSMSYEEGAALLVNYLTAYLMLFDMGNLRRGKSVLVHMAGGGVGIAATQLCKTVPDVTVYGTSSASKHEIIQKEGVTHPIDYRTQDYAEEIRKIDPTGVDIVLDPLGGADSTKGYNLLKPMGKIIHFGAANMVTGDRMSFLNLAKQWWATKSWNPLYSMSDNKCVCGFHLGHMFDQVKMIRDATDDLLKLFTEGKIKPRVDSVWAFEDVDKAMMQMHDRKNVGKVVLSSDKKPVPRD